MDINTIILGLPAESKSFVQSLNVDYSQNNKTVAEALAIILVKNSSYGDTVGSVLNSKLCESISSLCVVNVDELKEHVVAMFQFIKQTTECSGTFIWGNPIMEKKHWEQEEYDVKLVKGFNTLAKALISEKGNINV